MDFGQAFRTALRNLCANKVRFLHATLGVAIGIAGFVFALSCGNLSAWSIEIAGDAYASGVLKSGIYVNVDLPVSFKPADLEKLAENNPEVISGISPYVEFGLPGGVKCDEKSYDKTEVYGVGAGYIDMVPVFQLQEGRFLDYMDIARERKVCVIGNRVAEELTGGDALGRTLKIWGENYTVAGVFAKVPYDFAPSTNDSVFIPYPNAIKMVGEVEDGYGNYKYMYFMHANGRENMYDMQVLIKDFLRERTGREENSGWSTWATNMGDVMEKLQGYVIGQAIQQALCAGIVLVIGGVGVMNVMLASVQARMREIGIRKAFGATNRDIRRQFVIEAVITGMVGGLLGISIGFGIMLVLITTMEQPLSYLTATVWPSLAALLVTMLVGVIFGTYPAKQAMRLEPVAAINEG